MLVFNLHEEGDFVTEELILVDTNSKIRCIKENIPYLMTLYNFKDVFDVLCSERSKFWIKGN